MATTDLEPMKARLGKESPEGDGWVYEPKYDGVRVLAYARADGARLITRNGKEKAGQFPAVADALEDLARDHGRELVLDGEIVALDDGEPARFQALQERVHLKDRDAVREAQRTTPAALVAFDLLRDGGNSLVDEPWTVRRDRLEERLRGAPDGIRLGGVLGHDADGALAWAREHGWEGVIAKREDGRYRPGGRSSDWLKLKIEYRQELVVGGWTEPRRTRPHLGALLVGYYDDGDLVYAGHVGGGFTHEGLRAMHERLSRLERKTAPFRDPPKPNTTPHWVTPKVVVEVKFSEWTADGKLRQPIYLGTRDDKDPKDVTRESISVQRPA